MATLRQQRQWQRAEAHQPLLPCQVQWKRLGTLTAGYLQLRVSHLAQGPKQTVSLRRAEETPSTQAPQQQSSKANLAPRRGVAPWLSDWVQRSRVFRIASEAVLYRGDFRKRNENSQEGVAVPQVRSCSICGRTLADLILRDPKPTLSQSTHTHTHIHRHTHSAYTAHNETGLAAVRDKHTAQH